MNSQSSVSFNTRNDSPMTIPKKGMARKDSKRNTISNLQSSRTCKRVNAIQKLYLKMRQTRSTRYDYSSSNATYYQTTTYQSQCYQLLCAKFPFLKTSGVSMHLQQCNGRYHLCHSKICQALKAGKQDEEEQLESLETTLRTGNLTSSQIKALSIVRPSLRPLSWIRNWNLLLINTTLKKYRDPGELTVSPEVTDPILLDEVEFTEQEMDEWKMQIQNRKQRRSARERATKEGTTLECMCCYADCAFEEMVSCRDEGHLFCVDCLRKHTEDRVFGFADLGGKDGIEITCIQIGTYVTKNLASQSSCSGINLFHCYKLSSIRRL